MLHSNVTSLSSHDFLMEQFLQQVNINPNKKAVICQETSYTYKQFNNLVNCVAEKISSENSRVIDKVVSDQSLNIGIQMSDKFHSLLFFFAVLKLGGTCVPLNSTDPEERRQFVLDKSNIALLLSDSTLSDSMCNIMYELDRYANVEKSEPEAFNKSTNDTDAYILFTSGSTASSPKGVRQTRYGLWGQIQAYTKDLQITSRDCLLNLAILTHDQAMVDCFGALLNGCTLCLFDANNLQIPHLLRFIKENQVTIFSSIPSMFASIFENETDKNAFSFLRIITIGGEEAKRSHLEIFQRAFSERVSLVIGYGATEGSWFTYYYIPSDINLNEFKSIPLGYATESLEVKLLKLEDDDSLFELCVSSPYLSPGYFNDKAATENAFFIEEGKRYYRTGDLADMDANQCLYFMGRKAWHEKIIGKRVNLLEIEHALLQIGFPADAIVMACGEDEKRKLYVFYAQSFGHASLTNLKYIFPDYMVPRKAFLLDEMPKLPNGKINRQVLRKKLDDLVAYTPLVINQSDEISVVIEKKWRNSLELDNNFNINDCMDSFRELGGNSLGMMRLINALNHYFKTEHQLDFMLEPVLLDQYQNYTDFKNYLLKKYCQLSSKIDSISDQAIFKMPVLRTVPVKNYEYLDASGKSTRKNPETAFFDFNGLELIVRQINREHNISIGVGRSHQEILSIIKNAIDDVNSPAQIGLMLLKMDDAESHLTPAVLCIDREKEQYTLLVSEAVENEAKIPSLWMASGIIQKIHMAFSQMLFGFEFTKRQQDAFSCAVDGVLYLMEALKINMLDHIQRVNGVENNNFLKELGGAFYFLSPPQAYKAAMVDLPVNLNANAVISHEGRDITLSDFMAQNQERLFAQIKNDNGYFDKFKPMMINTYVWKQALEFKKILDKQIEEIRPSLLGFSISMGWNALSLYLYRDFLNEEACMLKLENYFSLIVPKGCNIRYIMTGYEILNKNHLMNCLTQSDPSPLKITVVTDADINKEAACLEAFTQKYKDLNPGDHFSFFSLKPNANLTWSTPYLSLRTIFMDAMKGDKKILNVMKGLNWVNSQNEFNTNDSCRLLAINQAMKELSQAEYKLTFI